MEADERQEVFVVLQADTLIDPDAVVVEFLAAGVAHDAVLRPGWFFN